MKCKMMMANKTVLLDVDGVIFHNKPMLNIVKQRITKYVQKHVEHQSKKTVSESDASLLTETLYKRYGHTLRGLCAVYGKADHLSVEEFNDYVYSKHTIRMLSMHLFYSADVERQKKDAQTFVALCGDKGYPVGILSNAPLQWCLPIIEHYKLDIASELTFTSSHPLFTESKYKNKQRFKPDYSLYMDVATHINTLNKQTSHPNRIHEAATPAKTTTTHNHKIVFIDDSLVNLMAVTYMKKWVPLHFTRFDDLQLHLSPLEASTLIFDAHDQNGIRQE